MGEELFLVLPEKSGARWPTSYWLTTESVSEGYLQYLFSGIDILSDFFDYEHGKKCFYDSRNIRAFKLFVCADEMTLLRKMLHSNGWEDIRENTSVGKNDVFEIYGIREPVNSLMTESAKRKSVSGATAYVLLAKDIIPLHSGRISINVNGVDIQMDSVEMFIASLHSWFTSNRQPERKYEPNPKHGEYGKGAHKSHAGKPVAVLLSSREHAEELLKEAIGVADDKSLYVIDKEYGKIMRYMPDTANSYHSFHLDEKDVSQAVMEKLSKL